MTKNLWVGWQCTEQQARLLRAFALGLDSGLGLKLGLKAEALAMTG
ncbi:MAG: hypothetical protein HY530_00090 [Chloroflexi bacterium]|nr:hypothetical protein [Chloroflexota bacterium]